jgi:hypothetical protein
VSLPAALNLSVGLTAVLNISAGFPAADRVNGLVMSSACICSLSEDATSASEYCIPVALVVALGTIPADGQTLLFKSEDQNPRLHVSCVAPIKDWMKLEVGRYGEIDGNIPVTTTLAVEWSVSDVMKNAEGVADGVGCSQQCNARVV